MPSNRQTIKIKQRLVKSKNNDVTEYATTSVFSSSSCNWFLNQKAIFPAHFSIHKNPCLQIYTPENLFNRLQYQLRFDKKKENPSCSPFILNYLLLDKIYLHAEMPVSPVCPGNGVHRRKKAGTFFSFRRLLIYK